LLNFKFVLNSKNANPPCVPPFEKGRFLQK
jgi:hypothetical protein